MPKIVLARPLVEAGMKVLRARKDVELSIVEDVTPTNIRAALKDAEAIIFRPANYQFSDPELDAAPKLKVVCRVGVGYDSIDVPALTRRGVQMATVGQANATTVAEHAIALMMGVGRKLALFDREMRAGTGYTTRFNELLFEYAGKTLVVIGFGRIGTRVVRRMQGWDMKIVVVDPLIDPARIRAAGAEPMDLDAALKIADVVTLHCPLSAETRGMINGQRLGLMKRSAILINTARGPIIEESALIRALKEKVIAGCGLDVTEIEPPEPSNELLKIPTALLSPHNAAQSPECVDRMNIAAAENALKGIVGRVSADCLVNPEVFK
ncbi:MAG: hydroxyacid dehydrogenase [Alphaproteobacteria bacterium]|nr:hydroxyacid dehydrogenase [Alphaproteobacteria bacterium]